MQPKRGDKLRHRPSIVTRRLARGRYFVFAGIVLISLFLGYRAAQTKFDFSVDAIYVFDDPALQFYRQVFVPQFGASDNMIVVLASSDNLFSPDVLHHLETIHNRVQELPGVGEVRSLVNARVPAEVDGAFRLLPIFDEGRAPATQAAADAVKAQVGISPTVVGRLVSKDMTTATIVILLNSDITVQAQRVPLVEQTSAIMQEAQEQAGQRVRFRLSGIPVISESITQLLRGDQITFVPGVLLVMGLLLYFAFRSARGLLLPFVATGTATIWTLGVMNLEGHSINVANNAIVVLLLVIGVSDAIHLLARYEEEVRRQRMAGITVGKLKTVAVVTQQLGIACLLTSITTAIGFGSLASAKLVIIQEYGLDAAIGVCLAYVATIGLIPALLGILPVPPPRRRDPRTRDISDRLLSKLAAFAINNRALVLLVSLVVIACSVYGASRIRPHDRVLAELPADHPTVEALDFATERLGGLVPFDVVLQTPPGRADDPDVLTVIHHLQRLLRSQPEAPRALSVMDLLEAVDVALRGANAPELAWSKARIAQYLLLLELDAGAKQELSPYLSDKRDLVRIACASDDIGTNKVLALRQALIDRAAPILPADVQLHVTGPLVVTCSALAFVVRDMATSLGLALVIILAVMGILFRSVRIGFLALVPNAIPVLMALGVMGFAGISLRPGTAVIFSMALGLAVDNSIHFLTRYREERARLNDVIAAVEAAIRGTGRPILYTTVMLSSGLFVLLASDFVALRHLAILGSTTFASAMVVDLLLLPVLLIWLKPR